MEKTILLKGRTFKFEEESLTYSTAEPMSPEEGKALLFKVKELFDAKGLIFLLGYGTLLGAVRNKSIIPGDEDLDVIVDNEDLLLESLDYFKENGLMLVRAFKGNVYSFRLGKRSYIDVYIKRTIPMPSIWAFYCYSISNREYNPKWLFRDIQDIEFLGGTFKCVKNPERLLQFWYGKTWRTPISGHKFYYEVKSHYYWKKSIRPFLSRTIKTLLLWKLWHK